MSALPQEAEVKNQGIGSRCDGPLWIDGIARRVIEATKSEARIMRYDPTEYEWASIKSCQTSRAAFPV
jgi:hypothetical protein